MKPPRGLSAEEAAAWAKVASTVQPLSSTAQRAGDQPGSGSGGTPPAPPVEAPPPAPLRPSPAVRQTPPPPPGDDPSPGLDSHWDRRFRSGAIEPDFTLDLHGHTLDGAYDRLGAGLAQARAMGARVVLVIAGKPRPAEAADRGTRRGAIRRKLLDWLAAGPHGASVAAIRPAHRKHGGEGALYLVLKRAR